MVAAGARRHLPGQHHLQRVADAGLVDRGGEVFFHQLTLLGGQHLAHVEVVFHTIIPHLLVQLAKGGQLLFDLSVIPFPGVNNVCQGTILIAADFNLAYIVFESLTQRLDLGDLILTQLQMLDDRVLRDRRHVSRGRRLAGGSEAGGQRNGDQGVTQACIHNELSFRQVKETGLSSRE